MIIRVKVFLCFACPWGVECGIVIEVKTGTIGTFSIDIPGAGVYNAWRVSDTH